MILIRILWGMKCNLGFEVSGESCWELTEGTGWGAGSVCKRTATLSFSLRRQTWHIIIPKVTSSCWNTWFVQNSCHSVRVFVIVQSPSRVRLFATPWTAVVPVLHYLPEFVQVIVQGVGDAVQPSHPLSPSFPSSFSLSQYQGLFQ